MAFVLSNAVLSGCSSALLPGNKFKSVKLFNDNNLDGTVPEYILLVSRDRAGQTIITHLAQRHTTNSIFLNGKTFQSFQFFKLFRNYVRPTILFSTEARNTWFFWQTVEISITQQQQTHYLPTPNNEFFDKFNRVKSVSFAKLLGMTPENAFACNDSEFSADSRSKCTGIVPNS
jgi:hypothetical protein